MSKDMIKQIKNQVADIEKKVGKGEVFLLGKGSTADVSWIPVESLKLTRLMGKGIPRGRIIEIYGPESGGKTTIASYMVSQAQKQGLTCGYIDTEQAFDPSHAEDLGVDTKSLYFSQPDSTEKTFEILEVMLDTIENLGIIVVDSVATMSPQAELDGDFGDSLMGLQARLMGQALRKLKKKIANKKVTVVFINQIRCIDKDSLIFTNNGLIKAKDIEINDNIGNKKVLSKLDTGYMKGVEIVTKKHNSVKVSENHMHVCIENGYKFNINKKAKDLTFNDWIVSPITNELINFNKPYINLDNEIKKLNDDLYCNTKKVKLPNVLDEKLAFILGAYFSDGYIMDYAYNSTYGVSWSEKNKDRYNLLKKYTNLLFDDVSCNEYSDTNHVTLNGKIYKNFFELFGFASYSRDKVVPELILNSNFKVIKSFIRGCFFDTHGFKENGFIFTCENKKATRQIQTILYYCGIFADYIKEGVSYRLYLTGDDAYMFNKIFGFAEQTKQLKANKFTITKNCRGKEDVVPDLFGKELFNKYRKTKNISKAPNYNSINMCVFKGLNINRKYLLEYLIYCNADNNDIELIKNNRFYKIEKLNYCNIDCIDIEVDKDNLYNLNGQMTHNCKIGVMFGNPETTTGGNALKFYASIRLDVRRKEFLGDKENPVGLKMKIKVPKNKVAPPLKVEEIDVYFNDGIDEFAEFIDFGIFYEFIEKGGSWFTLPDGSRVQGKKRVEAYFVEHEDEFNKLKEKIWKRMEI